MNRLSIPFPLPFVFLFFCLSFSLSLPLLFCPFPCVTFPFHLSSIKSAFLTGDPFSRRLSSGKFANQPLPSRQLLRQNNYTKKTHDHLHPALQALRQKVEQTQGRTKMDRLPGLGELRKVYVCIFAVVVCICEKRGWRKKKLPVLLIS